MHDNVYTWLLFSWNELRFVFQPSNSGYFQTVQWIERRLHIIPEFLLYWFIAKHDRGVNAKWNLCMQLQFYLCNEICIYIYSYRYVLFMIWCSCIWSSTPVVSVQSHYIQIMNHTFYHGYMCIKFTFWTTNCLLECFRLNWLSLWCPMFGEFTDEPLASCVVVQN